MCIIAQWNNTAYFRNQRGKFNVPFSLIKIEFTADVFLGSL